MNPLKLTRTLIRIIIKHHDSDWQRQYAGNYALATVMVLPLVTCILVLVLFVSGSPYAARTLPYFFGGTLVSVVVFTAYKKGLIRFAGLYIIFLYLLLGFGLVWSVGIDVGAMVFCSGAVIFAGTLCGYWCSFGLATMSVGFLFGFRAAELHDVVHPVYAMSQKPTNFGVVLLLALLFHFLTAVSGSLFRLERTRQKIRDMEQSFARQKNLLTYRMKKQSQKLQSAEFEKMQQVYRLAEVGETSAALMHDLANNLTTLALEIDGIEARENRTSVRRAKNQVKQINTILTRTRQQLKGDYQPKVFDAAKEISATIRLLRVSAARGGVTLEWDSPLLGRRFDCLGEKVLFGRLLTNIITNAIESYGQVPAHASSKPRVLITLKATDTTLHLNITDWGKGIGAEAAGKIFDPFYTTKREGLGMGLYLTKRFIENNFGGKIALASRHHPTTFAIELPRAVQK